MMNESSELDPSLPLNDDSLTPQVQPSKKGQENQESPVLFIDPAENVVKFQANPAHNQGQRGVRFTDTPLTPRDGRTPSPGYSRSRHGSGTRSRNGSGSRLEEGSKIEESTSWQVDGSNHSIVSDHGGGGGRGLTMKDYEEQLTNLRKENFNLKLRIYFLEENKGLFSGPVEQENLYRINIDLKVKGEELRRELEEHKSLVAEAATGLQSMEQKYKSQVDDLQAQITQSQADRKSAEERSADLAVQLNQLIECNNARDDNNKGGISEESRILYSDAFGSFASDSRIELDVENKTNIENLKSEVSELSKELDNKIEENYELKQAKDKAVAQLDIIAAERETAEKQLQVKLKEHLELKTEMDTMKNEKDRLTELLSKKDAQIADDLKVEISSLEDQIRNLETERDSNLTTIINQKRKIAELDLELKETEISHESKLNECNHQVSRLESELKKRNQEVCSFLNLIKRLQLNPQFRPTKKSSHENLINNDFIDLENLTAANPEDIDVVISESKDALEEILVNCSRVSPEVEQHLEYEMKRNEELEQILHSTEDKLRILQQQIKEKEDYATEQMEQRILDVELEKNQLSAKVEKKVNEIAAKEEEIKHLKEELATKGSRPGDSKQIPGLAGIQAKVDILDELKLSEANLKKSHLCIQGFANENLRLTNRVKELSSKQRSAEGIEKSRVMRQGIEKARKQFELSLATYRARYDRLRNCLKSRDHVCDMLRKRLEEITHFLSQLLENGDDTFNISNISMELKDQIHHSIEQSMLLTASLLNGSSILTEDQALGSEGDDDEIFDDDLWLVPEVSLPLMDQDNVLYCSGQGERRYSEGGDGKLYKSSSLLSLPAKLNQPASNILPGNQVPASQLENGEAQSVILGNNEYEELIVDLRDALRRRREAEESASQREKEIVILKENLDEAIHKLNSLQRNQVEDEENSFKFTRPKTPLGFIEELPVASIDSPVVASAPFSTVQDSQINQLADQRSRIPVRKDRTGGQPKTCPARSSSVPGRINGSQQESDKSSRDQANYQKSGLPKPFFFQDNSSLVLKKKQKVKVGVQLNDDEDSYSEPDKEESRRRIGIDVSEENNRESIGRRSGQLRTWEGREARTDEDTEVAKLAVEAENKHLEKKLAMAQSNLDTARTHITDLMAELKKMKHHASRQSTELVLLKEAQQKNSQEENQNKINELEVSIKGKDEKIKTLRKDLQESSIKISKLESESVDMEVRYQLEVDQVKQATTELVRFKLNHQKIVKENQEYERTVSSLKSHVQSLEKEREDVGRTLSNLRSQVTKLEEKRLMTEALEAEFNVLARERKNYDAEILYLKNNINQLEKESAESAKAKQALNAQISKLNADKLSAEKYQKSEIEKLNHQITKLTSKISAINKEKIRLENSKSVVDDLCADYKIKYNQLRDKYDEYQANLDTLKAEVNTKDKMIKSVESKLSVKENEIDALKDDLEKNHGHAEKYRTKWLESEKILKSMRHKVETKHLSKKVVTEDIIWRERLNEEDDTKINEAAQYNLNPLGSSIPGGLSKSPRKPLSTIDTNSANNLHLFGAKATPELQLGKLGSFLKDNEQQKENMRLFGGFSTDQQFGGFSVDGEFCCSAASKLGLTEKQLSEARLKLKNTEDELRLATDKISISNRRKKKLESAIVKELTKTRTVLKKAHSNLESCSSDQ